MSWTRFANILQTKALDRETKLLLIDLLAAVDDPKLEEEIFSFVFAWEEQEAQTQKTLIDGIKRVTEEYTQAITVLDAGTHKHMLTIADDLVRQKNIQDVRARITTL
jgi:hypothetical protein